MFTFIIPKELTYTPKQMVKLFFKLLFVGILIGLTLCFISMYLIWTSSPSFRQYIVSLVKEVSNL